MALNRPAIVVSALGLAAACNGPGPIVGGPCSYETDIVEVTVSEVFEDGASVTGPDGEFFLSVEYVRPVPAVGETLTIRRERIIEGTCTPEIYSWVDN